MSWWGGITHAFHTVTHTVGNAGKWVAHFGKDSAKGWSWAQSEINKGINAGENWTNQKVNQAETWTHHQVDRFEHSSIGNNWFGHEFGDGVDTTVKDVGSGVQARADFTGGVAKGITGLITGAAQLPGLGVEAAGDGMRYASSDSFRKKADHAIGSAASAVIHHPGAIANHLWDGVKKDWKKDPADFAGQATVFAASLVAGGVGAAGKLGLIGKAGEVTDAAAEGAAEVKGIQQAEQAGQAGAEAAAGSQTGEGGSSISSSTDSLRNTDQSTISQSKESAPQINGIEVTAPGLVTDESEISQIKADARFPDGNPKDNLNTHYNKHAGDFGLDPQRNNPENRLKWANAMKQVVNEKETMVIRGNYHGHEAIQFFNPSSDLYIALHPDGTFWTAYKAGPDQITQLLTKGRMY